MFSQLAAKKNNDINVIMEGSKDTRSCTFVNIKMEAFRTIFEEKIRIVYNVTPEKPLPYHYQCFISDSSISFI